MASTPQFTAPPSESRRTRDDYRYPLTSPTRTTSERQRVADLPPIDGVGHSTEIITGFDGNDIPLYISRPLDTTGPLPGVLHIHGGAIAGPTTPADDELAGLPPHLISVNELDPVRDEGVAY
jgi:acetyl esterase/lipase